MVVVVRAVVSGAVAGAVALRTTVTRAIVAVRWRWGLSWWCLLCQGLTCLGVVSGSIVLVAAVAIVAVVSTVVSGLRRYRWW